MLATDQPYFRTSSANSSSTTSFTPIGNGGWLWIAANHSLGRDRAWIKWRPGWQRRLGSAAARRHPRRLRDDLGTAYWVPGTGGPSSPLPARPPPMAKRLTPL